MWVRAAVSGESGDGKRHALLCVENGNLLSLLRMLMLGIGAVTCACVSSAKTPTNTATKPPVAAGDTVLGKGFLYK